MKSYIVKDLDAGLRKRLADSGVVFYDWENDIMLDKSNLSRLLQVLSAQAIEKATDHQELVEVYLRFNTVPDGNAARQRRSSMERTRLEYIALAGAGIADSLNRSTALNSEHKKAAIKQLNDFLVIARKYALAQDNSGIDDRSKRFQEEYARIGELPKVLAVRLCGSSLYVYTDSLLARDPVSQRLHTIGRFLLVVGLKPNCKHVSPVRWFNLDGQRDGILKRMHAPYVTSEGVCCATDAIETFAELTATFDLAVVIDLAIQFIETVYEDEAGLHVSKWPPAAGNGL